mgnify:CR=1 FL=1
MSAASDFLGGATPKIWVTGTTYAAGKVVWSPADYQYYMRKSAGAGSTDPSSDTTNWQPTGGRAVKSIQRGTVAYNVSSVTISAVVTAKCELRQLGSDCSDGGGVPRNARISLASTTSIYHGVTFGASGGSTSWELTEFY